MRRMWTGGVGIGLAVAAGTAAGQAPAARLGVVQALTESDLRGVVPAGSVVRGQMPTTPPAAPPQAGVLGQPRLFTGGPSVFEQRQPGAAAPTGVQPTAGYPVPAGAGFPPPTYTGAVQGPAGGMVADGGLFPSPQLDDPLFGCPPNSGGAAGVAASSAFNKWTISGEYLWWWTRSATIPALVTTSAPADQGVIGAPTTRVLLGNTTFGNTGHNGGRFGIGYWFGTEQRWGFEATAFFLGRSGVSYTADSTQYPVLARPFFSVNTNTPMAEYVATPLIGAVGGVNVQYENSLWGLDLNLRRYLAKTSCARLDLIGGFRYLSLEEGLSINENVRRTGVNTATVPFTQDQVDSFAAMLPLSGTVTDSFRTTNRFYGGQLGLSGEVRRGRWYSNLTGKAAFGTVFQSVNVNGFQSFTMPNGATGTAQGGLLALPGANIGNFTRNKFAVAPEVGLNVGYHITPRCRVYVGYTFLYLSNVLRPGDQIDTGLDSNRIPNFGTRPILPGQAAIPALAQTRPTVPFRDSDFTAQGVNVGLQFNW